MQQHIIYVCKSNVLKKAAETKKKVVLQQHIRNPGCDMFKFSAEVYKKCAPNKWKRFTFHINFDRNVKLMYVAKIVSVSLPKLTEMKKKT